MFELNIISPDGRVMPLVNNPYFIPYIDGLTKFSSSLATSTTYNTDGDTVNNVKTNSRDIVVSLTVRDSVNVNAAYEYLMQYVKPKQQLTLEAVRDDDRRRISGVFDEMDMPRFVQGVKADLNIYCNQPYWEDAEFIIRTIETIRALHYFDVVFPSDSGIVMGVYDTERTRTFTNSGHVAVGMEISIIANGTVVNPVLQRSDGKFIGIKDTLAANDEIIISTVKGNKRITKNGVNVLNKIMPRSTWLQLETGENVFTIDADSGEDNMYFTFNYKQRYV